MSDAPTSPIAYETPGTATNASAVAIGTIGLTLLGFSLLMQMLGSVFYLVTLLANPAAASLGLSTIPMYAGIVLQLAMSLAFIAFARPIATRLFRRLSTAAIDLAPPAWMTLFVAGVGLLYVIGSLDEGLRGIVAVGTRLRANLGVRNPMPVEAAEAFGLAMPLVKLGVGAFLFLRPRAIVGVWSRHAKA